MLRGIYISLQPLARPEDVKYDKNEGEQTIKLPARPPVVVMASWSAALMARELSKFAAPDSFKDLSFSRLVCVISDIPCLV